ncbi:hypothetical protein L873DRAFT_1130492 [Choiromyces venosus 120613-1]|uniref:Uncharacterized protein n=1 Tax=Choiromyces venosus 120613-1 TaxID=1336337 RepID=A0A3N4JGN3_9PEZI|nr:hypothetical protein L873DRAFT_1130492 [Choiromyces venosus 120613-1]
MVLNCLRRADGLVSKHWVTGRGFCPRVIICFTLTLCYTIFYTWSFFLSCSFHHSNFPLLSFFPFHSCFRAFTSIV